MNVLASTALTKEGIHFTPDEPSEKIIQRILAPRWSYQLKEECRMFDQEDEALVTQSRKGDAAAFELLIRKHQRMIHSLTYRMTGSMADAEDLAQETFIRAYRQIGSYRAASKFSTWLYRIAINACLTWRQRETLRGEADANWVENNDSSSSAGNDLSQRMQAALLKLPAKQRAAIMLTLYDGMNHAEAAEVLNCSETTVSWRVFAARNKLKRWLSNGREKA